MTGRLIILGTALLITLGAPFILKPTPNTPTSAADVISISVITPHNESIRHEFGTAFARHTGARKLTFVM